MPPRMPPHLATDQYRVPKPKNLKEVPSYVKKVVSGFFSRLFYIFRLVWEASPGIMFIMSLTSLLTGVLPVVGALIGKELLNKLALAYTGEITDFAVIVTLLIFQFAYMFLTGIINRIFNMSMRISGEIVSNHIRIKIMNKAKEVDVASYDSPEFFAKMENANREAGNRPIQILSNTFSMISTVITIVSYIVVLFAVSWAAPFIIILVSLPAAIVNFVYRRKNVNYMFRRSKDRRQMSYYADVIVNKDLVKEVRMYDLNDTFTGKYKEVFARYFKGMKRLIYSEYFWSIGMSVLTSVVNCLLFVFIAKGVFQGAYEIGNYSLYTGALTSISNCVNNFINYTSTIYEGTLFINNMITFMEEKPTIVPSLEKPRDVKRHCGHSFVFENVSFRYPGGTRDVIKNFSMTIDAGDTVVLVGLNGAGKTTLIKLLTRLYDPTEGRILLDGCDIKEYDVKQLYAMFGIIFQDFGKYAVSVRENIEFGDIGKKPTEADITAAAVHSNADAFIDKLPDKYDTPLMRYFEENGTELSIGQWQKLAIARAFYSDSDVLILDEPTASLDPMAEQEIFNQFDELREDKTTVFVSHRLSSATTADKIAVIDGGTLAELGSHEELMKKHGTYYTLFSTQAKRYIEGREKEAPDAPFPPPPRRDE